MRKSVAAAIVGGIIAIPCAWIAAASAIYCAGVGRLELFVFPFNQWIQVLPYWQMNWWMTLWVIIGAAVPTIITGLMAVTVTAILLRRTRQRPPVYGKTDWASRLQMDKSNITTARKPF